MNMPRFDIRQAEDGSRSIVIDGPSGERPIRISLSERQAGFGTDVANLVASLVPDCRCGQRANRNDEAIEDLISDAALAQDMFGDDELERFAEEYRRNAT
jgi:hypothetical protein